MPFKFSFLYSLIKYNSSIKIRQLFNIDYKVHISLILIKKISEILLGSNNKLLNYDDYILCDKLTIDPNKKNV